MFKHLAAEAGLKAYADSAGTGAWHTGSKPDERMQGAARRRGVDITSQRARQVDLADFYEFDYILAMDLANQTDLLAMAPPNRTADIRLFLDFASGETREVPDPYYGGEAGFDHVLDLVTDAADGLIAHLEDDE